MSTRHVTQGCKPTAASQMPPPKKNFGLVCVLCVVLCVERPVTSTNCRCEVSRDNLHVQEGYPLHVDPSRDRGL